ncbi:MAG: hypothetical protein P4L92_20880 [Rudaea sp.]|nr:hypothetical protein [Rudaea sp.]
MTRLPRWVWLFAALLLLAAIWQHVHRPIAHAPGVLVAAVPLQEPLAAAVSPLQKGNVSIKPLATFALSARVLSRADYRWDRGAELVPVDLALGWGRMSDSAVLDQVDISQSGRFYYWSVRKFPIPEAEIIESSANMHLIPADRIVEREIERTRMGDVVSFDGYLVEADWADGSKWISSLTRSDSGPGACELVWVEHFSIAPRR